MDELVTLKWAQEQINKSYNDGVQDMAQSILNDLTSLCKHTTNPKQVKSVCRACISEIIVRLHKISESFK